MVRMDPYCRIRVNHNILETDTDYNGAKNPHWTKSVSVALSEPIETIYIEVMDEVCCRNVCWYVCLYQIKQVENV